MGRHDGVDQAAEVYGKHSRATARGMGVRELLVRVITRGEAIRLAWRGDPDTPVDRHEEFPTAVLPAVAAEDELANEEEDTEPSTAVREARRWLWPGGFSWWPVHRETAAS